MLLHHGEDGIEITPEVFGGIVGAVAHIALAHRLTLLARQWLMADAQNSTGVLLPAEISGLGQVVGITGGELPPAESLPVTTTQLTGETGTERFILEESSSFLCSYGRYWDTGADDVRIAYTIVDVKCPLFYDMLLNEQEQQFLMGAGGYVADPEVAAHAELLEAEYARHAMNGLGDRWFICWDDRIVHLRASWDLTNEQLQIIKDSLMP